MNYGQTSCLAINTYIVVVMSISCKLLEDDLFALFVSPSAVATEGGECRLCVGPHPELSGDPGHL